jgi:hypothetical protein
MSYLRSNTRRARSLHERPLLFNNVGTFQDDVTMNVDVSFSHSVLFVDKKCFEIFDKTCINFYWTKMVAVNISHHIYLLIPEYCSITNSLIMCIHFQRKDLSYFVNK